MWRNESGTTILEKSLQNLRSVFAITDAFQQNDCRQANHCFVARRLYQDISS